MKKRNLLLSVFLTIFSFVGLIAQTTLSGKVTEAGTGDPLYGATVIVKGSNVGTITDFEGNYTLNVPAGATIIIVSYVGYRSEEVAISGGTANVELSEGIEIESVVVIGSRNATRTKLETAVPVDVIPIASVMSEVGQVDLNQILTYVAPSFQSARQTISDGTDHLDPAQLRGLGPDQVLVLVNGKRRHQSALVNVNGTVNRGTVGTDLSAIPASAIERIEILRDGAAAQYGSDAIAGVVNIVLKQRTGVLDGSISYGLYATQYDRNYALYKLTGNNADPGVSVTDGNTLQAGLNYGIGLGGRGFISLTGEYIDRDATNRTGTYTGQVYPNVNGNDRSDSIIVARGLTRETFDMIIGASEMTGGGVTLNGEYSVSNNWSIYAFGGYNQKNGRAAGFYRYPSSISSGATATYRNAVLAIYPDGFLPFIESDITDISFAAGLRGKIGENWRLDLSNTYGQNDFDFSVTNSINYTQFAVDPNNRQTEFDAGGLQFSQNTVNLDLSRKFDVLEGLNFALGGEFRTESFALRAGEEASYRNYDTASGAGAGAQVFAGFFPENAGDNSRNSVAGYLDLEQDFTKNWLVAAALRYENYSDFGSTFNYKVATRYKIGSVLSIRASANTGFRAPSMQQRFYAKTNTLFISGPNGLVPQQVGTFPNDSEPARILGIPELQEETSQSYTVGLTARTSGLEVSVDAYQIDIDNRIVLTNNFNDNGNAALKEQLDAVGAGQVNFFSNAVDTRSRGIEAVVAYGKSFDKHELKLTLAGAFIDNEVDKDANGNPIIHASPILIETNQVGRYFNREDQSRIEVANPKHKVSFTVNYKINKFSAMVRAVNFGEVVYLDPTIDPTKPDAFPVNAFTGQKETLDQTFSAKTVLDLSLTYRFLTGIGLTIGANNLLDTYQDIHTHSSNMSLGRFVYSRRVQQMGFNGRYIFARLKFDLR